MTEEAKATVPEVYGAISDVMAVMAKEGISKDRKNQQQGYSFRGIDDVYNALGKVLADNRLVMLPRVIDRQREERKTAKGGILIYTILTVEFDLVSAKDGSMHMVRMEGEAMDSADKSSNKAQSAALKYAALQVFMIPTEGDNDADAHTPEIVASEPRQRQTRDNAPAPTGPISNTQFQEIANLIERTGTDSAAFCKAYSITAVNELPVAKFADALRHLNKKLAAQEAIDGGIA